jgi:hypothetical protein
LRFQDGHQAEHRLSWNVVPSYRLLNFFLNPANPIIPLTRRKIEEGSVTNCGSDHVEVLYESEYTRSVRWIYVEEIRTLVWR